MFRSVQYPLKPASIALLGLAGAVRHANMLHRACIPQSAAAWQYERKPSWQWGRYTTRPAWRCLKASSTITGRAA